MPRPRLIFALLTICLVTHRGAVAAEPTGHIPQVKVSEPTRFDWVFGLANQSPAEPPAEWLKGYDSREQRYELYVPPTYKADKPHPLVLFISAGGNPAGFPNWEAVCRKEGILFASPYEGGNNISQDKRTRLVLDVLDDVRRKYNIDTDRTYVGGISGGGRIACAIAFALPEYFGGIVPVCAAGDLRDETWLRQRVEDRLSAALITGEQDFNRGEVERFRGPLLKAMGVETRVWTVPGMGHSIPDATIFAEAYEWLEKGVQSRREAARRYPAMRQDKPLSREEWAEALFAEAQERLKNPKLLYSGLMQMKGISVRWADLEKGMEARKLLEEYETKPFRPWEDDDIAEQRRALIARARALDRYASGELPAEYAAMRGDMLGAAIQLWEFVIRDGQDKQAVAEAKKRIPALERLAMEE